MESIKTFSSTQNTFASFDPNPHGLGDNSIKEVEAIKCESLDLPEFYEDIDETILNSSPDVTLEELDISMLATDAASALNGDFLDKDSILTEHWKDLKAVKMENGAILILKKDGTPMGWTTADAIKIKDTEGQSLPKDEDSGDKHLETDADSFLEKSLATAATFGIRCYSYPLIAYEAVVDAAAKVAGGIATPFVSLWDNVSGSNLNEEMWENINAFTSTNYSIDWMKENVWNKVPILKDVLNHEKFWFNEETDKDNRHF